jgi:hypothetical protein
VISSASIIAKADTEPEPAKIYVATAEPKQAKDKHYGQGDQEWCPRERYMDIERTGNITSVHSEIVDFDFPMRYSGSVFATTGIVRLFRKTGMAMPLLQKSENEALGQKMLFPDGH